MVIWGKRSIKEDSWLGNNNFLFYDFLYFLFSNSNILSFHEEKNTIAILKGEKVF